MRTLLSLGALAGFFWVLTRVVRGPLRWEDPIDTERVSRARAWRAREGGR